MQKKLIEKKVIVKNVNGLDMKTAALVAEAASQFSADIFTLSRDGLVISILEIISTFLDSVSIY